MQLIYANGWVLVEPTATYLLSRPLPTCSVNGYLFVGQRVVVNANKEATNEAIDGVSLQRRTSEQKRGKELWSEALKKIDKTYYTYL